MLERLLDQVPLFQMKILQKTIDTDIHKILSAVPGVFFRTEDGYG